MAGIITILLSAQLAPLKPRTRLCFGLASSGRPGATWRWCGWVPDLKTISSL